MVCLWNWAIMKLNTIQQGICLTNSCLDGTLIWSLRHIWALRIHRSSKKGKKNCAQKLRRRLQFGYKLAREKNHWNSNGCKQNCYVKVSFENVLVENRILVRYLAKTNKCHLVDYLKINLYIVVEKPVSDIPVYRVGKSLVMVKLGLNIGICYCH